MHCRHLLYCTAVGLYTADVYTGVVCCLLQVGAGAVSSTVLQVTPCPEDAALATVRRLLRGTNTQVGHDSLQPTCCMVHNTALQHAGGVHVRMHVHCMTHSRCMVCCQSIKVYGLLSVHQPTVYCVSIGMLQVVLLCC